jgi:hypothetical protein
LNQFVKESISIESLNNTLNSVYIDQFAKDYLESTPVSTSCLPPPHFPSHSNIINAVEGTVLKIFKCFIIEKKPKQLMRNYMMYSFVSHLLNVFQTLSLIYSGDDLQHVKGLLFYERVYRYLSEVCQYANLVGVKLRGDSTEPTLYKVSLLPDYENASPFKRWLY